MSTIRFITATTILIAGLLVSSGSFASSLAIRLDDTLGNFVVIADNGAGDINPTEGAVSWSGALGSWIVNVTTGIGTAITPDMIDLNSVNVTGGSGTLEIAVSETDVELSSGRPIIAARSSIGGVANGIISAQSYVNSDNILFSTTGTQIMDLDPLTGAFSSSIEGFLDASLTTASLTNVVKLVHDGAGIVSSFDFETVALEGPSSTLPLFGAGFLVGMFALRRRVMS